MRSWSGRGALPSFEEIERRAEERARADAEEAAAREISEKPMVLSGSEASAENQASHFSEKPQVLSGSEMKAETGETEFLEEPVVLSGPGSGAEMPASRFREIPMVLSGREMGAGTRLLCEKPQGLSGIRLSP